jgi:hypothetical protein
MPRDYLSDGPNALDMPNKFWIRGRNVADTADLPIVRINGLDQIEFGQPITGDGAGAGGGGMVFNLANDTAVGATSITLDHPPPTNISWIKGYWVIDAGTVDAEIRAGVTPTGATLPLAALSFAHTAGDPVVWTPIAKFPVELWGAYADGADYWTNLQRAVIAASNVGGCLTSQSRTAGFGSQYRHSKPLAFGTNSVLQNTWFSTHASYVATSSAAWPVATAVQGFTASAATNTFTCSGSSSGPGSFAETNHTYTMFADPYGTGLPGGITSGQIYYIRATPTTSTFTVSATQGGPELDITSDGGGIAWLGILTLSRVFWDYVRFDVNTADVNGVWVCMQQPSAIKNIRVEMTAAATTAYTYGIDFGSTAQIGYMENVEVNPNTNCIGINLRGFGMILRNVNIDAYTGSSSIGILVGGNACTIDTLWTEDVGYAGVWINSAIRGLKIQGSWNHSSAGPALRVSNADASYDLSAPIYRSALSSDPFFIDSTRGLSFTPWNGLTGDAATGETDDQGQTYYGHIQGSGTISSPTQHYSGPRLRWQWARTVSSDLTLRYRDNPVTVDNASTHTITLPPGTYMGGHQVTILNGSSLNLTNLATSGSDTVAGFLTTTGLRPNEYVTLMSSGTSPALWTILARGFNIEAAMFNNQTGTSYTLTLADDGKWIQCTNASPITVTLPTNASVALAIGSKIEVIQNGAGQVTFSPAGGVTLNSPGGKNKTIAIYSKAILHKTSTNTWLLDGDITT